MFLEIFCFGEEGAINSCMHMHSKFYLPKSVRYHHHETCFKQVLSNYQMQGNHNLQKNTRQIDFLLPVSLCNLPTRSLYLGPTYTSSKVLSGTLL